MKNFNSGEIGCQKKSSFGAAKERENKASMSRKQ